MVKITPARSYNAAAAVCLLLLLSGVAAGWQRAKQAARKTPAATVSKKGAAKKSAAKKTAPKKSAAKAPASAPTLVGARRPSETELASLVRAYREAPTPARRIAIENYAAAHAKDSSGALARFALGVAAYENREYTAATAALAAVESKLPKIADYVGYYLAAARLEAQNFDAVARSLGPARSADLASPLATRSWILEARALQQDKAPEAVRVLRAHYAELPQPEGDLALADCYQAMNESRLAAEFYQRVYYSFLSGDAAGRAAAALLTLQNAMGSSYPPPSQELRLRRADRLFDARDYGKARAEYEALAGSLTGVRQEQAQVRAGASRMLDGNPSAAASYLRGLDPTDSETSAERLYYLAECGRRLGDDNAMLAAVKRLAEFPKSPWRLKALLSAANRFLLVNRAESFVPLYQAIADDFPNDPVAGLANWKVTFQQYLSGANDAEGRLRDHLRRFPAHATTGAALYFLGRTAERENDFSSARACYQRLARAFQNHYYAMLARDRLAVAAVSSAPVAGETAKFVNGLELAQPKSIPTEPVRTTAQRIERSRLLRAGGLTEMAEAELRYGARTDSQPQLIAMEMAAEADSPARAMRFMKSLSPEYLNLSFDQAPRRYWEYLFPLPYRFDLESSARREGLDPFLLAGLIRQESEFNPQAVSSAKAYGLTQVRPGTGRDFARRAGVSGFTTSVLFQPSANLKIGASILRSMLDRQSGKVEQTLAAYNAGPNRVVEWQTWANWREPAEFIESIPFTETRDYVQAVLRNADLYRRLYR